MYRIIYATIILLIVCITAHTHATHAAQKGNVGVSINKSIDDWDWGILGEFEQEAIIDTKIEGHLQSGNIYRGNLDASFYLGSHLPVHVKFYSNNTLKGYSIGTLGRVNDLGASIVVPIENHDVSIGIFGRNGNPFAKPNAVDTLVPLGYNEDQLTQLGLADIFPKDRGLTIKEGSSLNAAVQTELQWTRFDIDIKALLELFGEGHRIHQVLTNIKTGGELTEDFDWNISIDIGTQLFDETIEYETAWIATIGYQF